MRFVVAAISGRVPRPMQADAVDQLPNRATEGSP